MHIFYVPVFDGVCVWCVWRRATSLSPASESQVSRFALVRAPTNPPTTPAPHIRHHTPTRSLSLSLSLHTHTHTHLQREKGA